MRAYMMLGYYSASGQTSPHESAALVGWVLLGARCPAGGGIIIMIITFLYLTVLTYLNVMH